MGRGVYNTGGGGGGVEFYFYKKVGSEKSFSKCFEVVFNATLLEF